MSKTGHETLALRLAEILLKLNQGEVFSRKELAEEFGVTERTIYRDLNRLGGVVDRLPEGQYQLSTEYRGKLHPKDLESFAALTGVNNLFPNSSHRFLVALLDTLSHSSILVKGHHYEQLKPQDPLFQQLDAAIREKRICHITFSDKRRTVLPYRLVNNRGIWYLAATENSQLKAYSLSRISLLHTTGETFTPSSEVKLEIEDEDDIWYSEVKTEVLIKVEPAVAYYFLRRKLLPRQETVRELENGSLIVSSRISHANQILPIIRYWIPNATILEPVWLKHQLENELKDYLH